MSLDVSPDGRNLYSSEGNYTGAVAEFARNANGSLTQLSGTNDCIEENACGDGTQSPEGCGTQSGHGLGDGGTLQVSPDGANVFVDRQSRTTATAPVMPPWPSSAVAPTERWSSSRAPTTASRNTAARIALTRRDTDSTRARRLGWRSPRDLTTSTRPGKPSAPPGRSPSSPESSPSSPCRSVDLAPVRSRMGPAGSHARPRARTPTRLGVRSR